MLLPQLEAKSSTDIDYLKQQQIGEVIGEALTEIYLQKPKFPIDFLSKWLLNYCAAQKAAEDVKRKANIQKQLKQEYDQQLTEARQELTIQQEQIQTRAQQYSEFQEMFTKHQYQEELLERILPDFISNRYNVNCYIGFLDYPTKQPLEISDEVDGHLDKSLPKVIKYIGYCANSLKIMKEQTLLREEGVSWQVLKGQLEDDEPQDDQNQDDEDNGYPVRKPTYLYIPNVVKNEQIKYFKIPALGSYLCNALSYFSCFETIDSLEQGVQTRSQYQQEKEEKTKRRLERETEIQELLKDHEEEPEEIQQIEEQFQTEKETDPIWIDTEEPEFIKVRRSFILACDTLGQDKEIPLNVRDEIELLAQQFVQAWESSESQILSNDINQQIQYLDSIAQSYEQILDGFNQDEENLIMERQPQLDEFKDKEAEKHYEEEAVRLEKVCQQLQDSEVLRWFQTFKGFRMIKFPGILQAVLLLLGYPLDQISIPGTFNLN